MTATVIEWLVIVGLFVAVFLFVAFFETGKRTHRKRSLAKKSMGSGLFVIDEIFHPSAHESSIVMEEKREERKATPSPEDKENPRH